MNIVIEYLISLFNNFIFEVLFLGGLKCTDELENVDLVLLLSAGIT